MYITILLTINNMFNSVCCICLEALFLNNQVVIINLDI